MVRVLCLLAFLAVYSQVFCQEVLDRRIEEILPEVLQTHREFVSIPNVASDKHNMLRNLEWARSAFENSGFEVQLLPSSTLPVFFAERKSANSNGSVLFYLHIDGQPVDPANWDQPDPFKPVLKQQLDNGDWEIMDWSVLEQEINPEWRVFARAAADDKGPIIMMLTAMQLIDELKIEQQYDIRIILDPQEEAGSDAFLSTLEKYRDLYKSDYMVIMDGPAHPTNKPTLTLGCRGIASCSITLYGAKLPQHSGHYGNYSPNPVFEMAHVLASMKDEQGLVTIDGYYDEVKMTREIEMFLDNVPDDEQAINEALFINKQDQVGPEYQKSLQYPSLNVRHIETSWKGPGLKTVIPEVITAHLDVRLVKETDGARQLQKIHEHLESLGYLVLKDAPTDEQRLNNSRICTFKSNPGVNAFRTDIDAPIVGKFTAAIKAAHDQDPVLIRTMGGTVPIIEAVDVLDINAIIVPMVNMDNNQHNPNENLRIGNMIDGIKTCVAILGMKL